MNRWERYSLESLTKGEQDEFGRLFISPKGQRELSRINLLHAGIDTIRQLYRGQPIMSLFECIISTYHEGRGATLRLFDTLWAVGAGATGSGFRYRLQNNELGVIIFLGARHAKLDGIGTHVKIELSPHFIHERGSEETQRFLDCIAAQLLDECEPIGCAIHLALDVQGWEPPKDFMERFVTRSKKVMRIDGIDDMEFDLSSIAATYGRGETMMFGKAGALQACIYNKTKQAHAVDKIHFWEGIWQEAADDEPLSSAYDPDLDVWRIEMRFHQSVLREFAQGVPCNPDTGEELDMNHGFKRFLDVVPHLTGIWRSALQSHRLDHTRNLIDAAWQLFQEDPRFLAQPPHFLYKRKRKAAGIGNEKNVALVVGNLISLYARQGFTVAQAIRGMHHCGVWDQIAEYFRHRGIGADAFRKLIGQKLIERRLLGRAA
ncbi:hypothetical protein GCM10027040_05210 [Halomonas shantousis]